MSKTFKMLNGDVSVNRSSGQIDEIADGLKLKQDIKELILIDTQTDNGFGAGLDSMVGALPSDELSPGSMNASFGIRVRRAFDRMVQLQKAFHFGQRSLTEQIYKVLVVRASPDITTPTKFRFTVSVISVAGLVTTLGGNINLRVQ